MWASGVYDLGLTDAQFWAITPRQFHALYERHLDAMERQARNFGLLAVLYGEAHRDKTKRAVPFMIEDFVPSRRGTAAIAPAKGGHCPECGLHEAVGHSPDCNRGQQLVQYGLAQMTLFYKQFPAKPGQVVKGEPLSHG
jgi:hypothetical protein